MLQNVLHSSFVQLRFTEMLKERFGWDGPPDGKKSQHDYLPLVIQADHNGPPELFELPLDCAPPVHIHHPRYPGKLKCGVVALILLPVKP